MKRTYSLLPFVLFSIMETAIGQTAPTPRVSSVSVRSASTPSDTLATLLARAGYLAIPLGRTPGRQFRYIKATIDSTPVKLLLDSGYSGELALEPDLEPQLRAGEIRIGALRLDVDVNDVWLYHNTSLDSPENLPGGKGFFGATLLTRYAAIVDYVTDTLYLLAAAADSGMVVRPPAPVYPNLLAALQDAGHYQTFLALMRDAGLTPLLEGGGQPAPADSLHFRERAKMVQSAALDDSTAWEAPHLGQLTAFVPTDAAFAQLPPGVLPSLRADSVRLTAMLRAHLLFGASLDTTAIRRSWEGVSQRHGPTYGFHRRGTATDIDRLVSMTEGRVLARARVVAPQLSAGNGTAYGIDRPLIPVAEPSPLTQTLVQQGYVSVPMYRAPNRRHVVRTSVDSEPLAEAKPFVDTGASCDPPDTTDVSVILPSLDSSPKAVSLTLDSVRVGPANATLWDSAEDEGVICIHFLTRHHSRLDFATGTLYLRLP